MAAALSCAAGLVGVPGHAQSTSDELARRHFDSGVAYLEESDYDNALKAFQKSYELSKRPEILLNIATVHERRSDLPAAVAALRSYLEAAPQGEHVETVKLRISNLEKRIHDQASAQPPTAASAAPAAAVAAAQPPPQAPPAPPPAAHPAEPNRLPAFIALGAGGLFAGSALVTGILAKTKYDDAKQSCAPSCSDAELASSRTFAISSTVLTGGAVVGVGLGVALLLIARGDSDELATGKTQLDVALGPKSAAASARWRF